MKDLRDWYSYLERSARTPAVPSRPAPPSDALRPAATPAVSADRRPRRPGRRPLTETREQIIQRLLDPELTLHEAAALLDVSKATLRRYTDQGKLVCFRTAGRQRRFKLSDVLAFLEPPSRGEGRR